MRAGLLDAPETADLTIFFQQRHLLAHREGIVGQEYIDRSQDFTYRAGQKISPIEQDRSWSSRTRQSIVLPILWNASPRHLT